MSVRRSMTVFVTGTLLLAISLLSLGQPHPAFAQCGDPGGQPSSCTTCHATQDPVADKGEWHLIHASKDICINCHGGNANSMDKVLAHENMTPHPLEDIYTDCHACHPDYVERAERFAPTLGVTPGSCATPTTIAASYDSGGPPAENIVMPSNNVVGNPTTQPAATLLIVSSGMLALALFVFALSWRMHHRVGN